MPSTFNGIPTQTIKANASMPARIIPNRNLKIMTTTSLDLSIGAVASFLGCSFMTILKLRASAIFPNV